MTTENEHTFNGVTYTIKQDEHDKRYILKRHGTDAMGSYAAFHGAIDAACSDAYPRTERRTLRRRPG